MTGPSARIRRVGIGVVGLAVSVLAVAVLVAVIDVGQTAAVLARTDLGWVALTLLMVPAQILLRGLRWALLLPRRGDGRRPSVWRILPPMLTGYFANLVLPARLGEPVRGFLVARRERLAFSRVLGSILLERVMDLATLAAVAVVAAIVVGAPEWMLQGTLAVALFGLTLVGVLAVSGIARVVRAIGGRVASRVSRLRTVIGAMVSFGEGAGGDGTRALLGAIGLSTITWFFVAATYWLLGRSLGIPLTPAEAMLVAAVATLGTAIPSAPAYIGTFEVAAVGAAAALGIQAEPALALALLAHAITTIPFAAAGAAAVAWMSVSLDDVAEEAVTAATWSPESATEAEPTA